jgi:hypothetical protein
MPNSLYTDKHFCDGCGYPLTLCDVTYYLFKALQVLNELHFAGAHYWFFEFQMALTEVQEWEP